ncbi:1-acyl-sn-glycerol-3-phosphate acyltransferase [Haloferula sp. BvORR071]|uniref:1-acyl-sn-glycerol-3-phosphate acyltransferase n=1 Tax=Haloferula sp. BvORR071 TaxID=1396141 RepID=UPI00055192A5|nr:1-acyl-sn-glycerol-3-phosphate acyltransferase [Haloferula sp. BvORR071]
MALTPLVIFLVHSLSSTTGTAWHRLLHRCICAVWFDRVIVTGSLPKEGPLLLVSCHRNGAVDGFLLHSVHPRLEFMIAGRLVRQWWLRVFFSGIPVERPQDGKADNSGSMAQCLQYLQHGGALCVFPEGTSSLGPHHLPFHSGAARLALAFEEATGRLPQIVPVGLHYEDPGHFRSRVEVTIGEPLEVSSEGRRLVALKNAINTGLLTVGTNFEDALHQEIAERAASHTNGSRYHRLKAWEGSVPAELSSRWQRLRHGSREMVAEAPRSPLPLLLAPLALPGYLLNAPVFMAAHVIARRLAAGPNVVALWKILAGSAAAALWMPLALAGSVWAWGPKGAVAYAISTVLAVRSRNPLRAAWRKLRWLLASPAERKQIREIRALLTQPNHA